MRRPLAIAALLLFLTGLLLPAATGAQVTPAASAGTVSVTAQRAQIDFPAGIDFSLTAHAGFVVSRLELFYRVSNQDTEHLALVPLAAPGTSVHVTYRLDLQTDFVPAGIDLVLFWRFHDTSGRWTDTPPMTAQWYDNRYAWATITTPDAVVAYHGISPAFARNIATSTQQSIDALKARYGFDRVAPLKIWIYPNTDELSGSRQLNTREAVAGLSYPEFALITAAIPDGSAGELGRVMPHEISHQLLYQATRNPWNAPPVWLDEGLAEYAQSTGTDGFARTVQAAQRSGSLLGLAGLTLSYPYSPEAANLAYAESFSVVTYIVQTYGDAGITRLVRELATGQSYDQAFQHAFGSTMTGLEADWRAWVASTAATADGSGALGGMRLVANPPCRINIRW